MYKLDGSVINLVSCFFECVELDVPKKNNGAPMETDQTSPVQKVRVS